MRTYNHKRPKYRSAKRVTQRVKRGDNLSHDGFHLHRNPDGTWLFIEGTSERSRTSSGKSYIWGNGDTKKLESCCKRRGISGAGTHWKSVYNFS